VIRCFLVTPECGQLDQGKFRSHSDDKMVIFIFIKGRQCPRAATPPLTTSPGWINKGGARTWSRFEILEPATEAERLH